VRADGRIPALEPLFDKEQAMISRKFVASSVARLAVCTVVACVFLIWPPILARPAPADPQEPSSKPETAGKDKAGEEVEAKDKKKDGVKEGETPKEDTSKASGKAKTKGKAKGSQKAESPKDSGKGAGKKAEGSKPAETAKDKEPAKKVDGAKAATPDADAAFVKENLGRLLFPSSSKFQDDGRVVLEFDFREHQEEHGDIFSIPVGKKLKDPFRWTLRTEEWEDGIRISNAGIALLKCWFKDDVEAEMELFQHTNCEPKHIAAVIFANGKGSAIGSNYGGQCAVISSGRISQAKGKTIAAIHDSAARIKLVVKNGTFEAHRDGRQRTTSKYSPKTYASGQIGFYWGGSLSATITKLTITGRLDNAKMAAEIRKGVKS
jgi:hypothetical protein